MEQIAKIGDYITPPDCMTTGTVKNIQEGSVNAIGQDPISVYEIEIDQGGMRIPANWLARLIRFCPVRLSGRAVWLGPSMIFLSNEPISPR